MDFSNILSKMNTDDDGETLTWIKELLDPSFLSSSIICQITWKFLRPLLAIIAKMTGTDADDKIVKLCDKIMAAK